MRDRSPLRERAQSETLGFVLIFSLVVTIIGITFATGFGGLHEVRNAEQVNNAQRAFDVLADNIGDLVHRTAPSRATEIKLSGASIGMADPIEVNVSVGGFDRSYEIHPIEYDADTGAELFYSAGAVIRQRGGSGLVVSESVLLLDANRTMIPIVQTRPGEESGIAGSGSVLVRTEVASREIHNITDTDGTTVWFNVTTPRAGTWRDHLTDKDDVTCEPISGETVSCQVTTDHAIVVEVLIDVSFR
ncbi:MAG: hypothetical protein ABEJ85_04355 [Haloarculaceae archaeon]